MTTGHPQNWHRIKAVFQAAIERPLEDRAAFLTTACDGDVDLRAEVESLLAHHDDEGRFLEPSAIARVFAGSLDDPRESIPSLAPGTTIGQYEILEPLGAGGMGEVYRARDTRLHRHVALKVVQESAALGQSVDRVLREARAASALNHPHICTIYEVGEFEGRPYLAMEYVAGQPLNAVIPPGGLPPQAVVTYGAQIADALAHAHLHHVVHRDLKAANVVVTPEGRAKVLDFGLAKRLPAPDADTKAAPLTQPGAIAGTPAYMAPELLRGQAADARSDIWALGVLLYEMASGRRPFTGETSFEVTSAILKDSPRRLPSRVPSGVQAVILRCLERDPARRYQHASEVKAALDTSGWPTLMVLSLTRLSRRAVAGIAAAALLLLAYSAHQRFSPISGPPTSPTSVAVLPFRMLSAPDNIGFLGIGLADTIIARLSTVRQMRVRPTSAVFAYEKEAIDPPAAGRALAVEYVLTGTIQQSGNQIRVTPQLVRVSDGEGIWGRAYTFDSDDLLGLQDQIAVDVADALQIRMSGDDRTRVYRRHTQDPEAYALYLRGRSQLVRSQREGAVAAVASFQHALERDDNYVLAHAGIAMASAQMRLFFAPEHEVADWETRAHRAARRAVQLGPDVAEAHEALAAVYRSAEFDWHQAIEESTRALALNPSLDGPHLYRASAFSHLGLLEQVPAAVKSAMEINPANVAEPLRVQGVTAMFAGRFDEAVALLENARTASGKLSAEWNLANAYYYAGRQTAAETMLRDLRGSARSERRAQATLASFLAARGDRTAAQRLIDVVTASSYIDHHVAYALGAAYAQLGVPAEAIRWLTHARTTGFPCYPWFERDSLLIPLKDQPVFKQFLEEFRRSWETTRARHGSQIA